MQTTITTSGETTTTDYNLAVTGSRMQLVHKDTNLESDCAFAKAGPLQPPTDPTPSQSALSRPAPSTSAPPSQLALIGHTWELNDITASPDNWGLSAVEEGTGITRRTFTFQPDGTIAGHDEMSPPDPNDPGTFTMTYVLNGSSLDTRDNLTVERLDG
jgi:hypothetical protein